MLKMKHIIVLKQFVILKKDQNVLNVCLVFGDLNAMGGVMCKIVRTISVVKMMDSAPNAMLGIGVTTVITRVNQSHVSSAPDTMDIVKGVN